MNLLREHNCDGGQMDVHATKVPAGYTTLEIKRVHNVKLMRDKKTFEWRCCPLEMVARKIGDPACTDGTCMMFWRPCVRCVTTAL